MLSTALGPLAAGSRDSSVACTSAGTTRLTTALFLQRLARMPSTSRSSRLLITALQSIGFRATTGVTGWAGTSIFSFSGVLIKSTSLPCAAGRGVCTAALSRSRAFSFSGMLINTTLGLSLACTTTTLQSGTLAFSFSTTGMKIARTSTLTLTLSFSALLATGLSILSASVVLA
jgi:hypothetical protein